MDIPLRFTGSWLSQTIDAAAWRSSWKSIRRRSLKKSKRKKIKRFTLINKIVDYSYDNLPPLDINIKNIYLISLEKLSIGTIKSFSVCW